MPERRRSLEDCLAGWRLALVLASVSTLARWLVLNPPSLTRVLPDSNLLYWRADNWSVPPKMLLHYLSILMILPLDGTPLSLKTNSK